MRVRVKLPQGSRSPPPVITNESLSSPRSSFLFSILVSNDPAPPPPSHDRGPPVPGPARAQHGHGLELLSDLPQGPVDLELGAPLERLLTKRTLVHLEERRRKERERVGREERKEERKRQKVESNGTEVERVVV